jgi:murein tripeptide amidase MpaA
MDKPSAPDTLEESPVISIQETDIEAMAPETTEKAEDDRVTTTTASSKHPSIVEPAKSVGHPVIHLYSSLSAGSSYVCLTRTY